MKKRILSLVDDLRDINLEVKFGQANVPDSVIADLSKGNPVVLLTLTYNGNFGFKARLRHNFGTGFAGKYANIFWDKEDGTTVINESALVDKDGYAEIPFTHASEYVIVISTDNMKEAVVLSNNHTTDTNPDVTTTGSEITTTAPQTSDSCTITLLVMLLAVCLMTGAAVSGWTRNNYR